MIIPDNDAGRERAASVIKSGGIVAFRTDTFYGLGADPFSLKALHALNELKGRDDKPILVLIADLEETRRLLDERTRIFDALTERHWPGALTLVAHARKDVPHLLTAGTNTIGVRLPDDEQVRAFVRACGGTLTATSANPAGRTPARTAAEVKAYFQDEASLIIVDGGESRSHLPSTVLDTRGTRPRIIREGVVRKEELAATLKTERAALE